MTDSEPRFPDYTPAERRLDYAVHAVGVALAPAAGAWLLARASHLGGIRLTLSMVVYVVGLVGMLATSAAYHFAWPSRRKAMLRRADHSMIFVMIAGSYTPFALNALPATTGAVLCGAIWTLAAGGVGLTLAAPRWFKRLSLALYLVMGWAVVAVLPSLIARLPGAALWLVLAGGLSYTVGALIHTRHRLRFHTVIWHMLVLLGAGLHVGAVGLAFLAG
jgi:hemolysin III